MVVVATWLVDSSHVTVMGGMRREHATTVFTLTCQQQYFQFNNNKLLDIDIA